MSTTESESQFTASEIADHAKSPQRVTTDEGTVQERSTKELIEADRYTKSCEAVQVPFGLRVARMRFPGTP